jgi:protein tyrosine phosphatase
MSKQRLMATLSLVVLCILTIIFFFEVEFENFHTLIPKKVYRSAQLSPSQLNTTIHKYGIHSLLNLRGINNADAWYRHEIKVTAEDHTHFYNVRLASLYLPTQTQLRMLEHIILTAPKPLLIHCASGADRTGLAAAMVILLHNGSISEASRQASWRYGAIRPQSTGKQMMQHYQTWLHQQGYSHSTRIIFQKWLNR